IIEKAAKARSLPEGMHSLGTRALHVKARVNSVYEEPIEARLDPGADITLISEEYWRLVLELGPPKQGLRMTLYHLTGEAKVMGYVTFPLFTESTDSTIIHFETEAYVICNMKVPLLLGVSQQSNGACEVSMAGSSRVIPASTSRIHNMGFEVCQAFTSASLPRNKVAKNKQQRDKRMSNSLLYVAADEDVVISANSVRNVRISGPLEGKEEWLVEKMLIGTEDTSVLASPLTWVNSRNAYLPIANTSSRPWTIKKGDL
ncbi:hypothetical protein BDP27DRAFT_1198505, partial [Rhodocollybia butyracea]